MKRLAIFGLAAIISLASCSTAVDTKRLLENYREISKSQRPKELHTINNSRVFSFEDYVIEETESGGSARYMLKYTGIYPPNNGVPYIFVVASEQVYDELGSLISDIEIRDGNKSKSLDGRADVGYTGRTILNPLKSQKSYRKIASKVVDKW